MQVKPPTLAPILRSDAQGRLLAALYLRPERELTATALAEIADMSVASASRELSRLQAAGYVTVRASGRNKYARVNPDHALYKPVAEVLRYAYGPLPVLSEALGDIEGVCSAYIHGSWAARLAGEPGPDPHDIDVIVIGDGVDLEALAEAAEAARRQLGREVNMRALTPKAWTAGDDVFLKHVRERPLAKIPLAGDDQ